MADAGDEGWMQSVAGGDESVGDGVSAQAGRWLRSAVVYAGGGGGPVRSCDACERACAVGDGGDCAAIEKAVFHTRSGVLTASRKGDWIELDFPATPAVAVEAPVELLVALGVEPVYIGKSIFDYLVEVGTEEAVREVAPDFGLLAGVPCRGVMVTSRASGGRFDFVSRFFAPGTGVNEDPVTGSAHCTLGPFWQSRTGKSEFVAYQASRRGGEVKVRVAGDRVMLGGQAVTVMRGTLHG